MITLANLSKLGNIDYCGRIPFAAASVELRRTPSAPGHGKHLQGGRAELQRGAEAAWLWGRTAAGPAEQRAVLGHVAPKSRTHSSLIDSMAVVVTQQWPWTGAH